jgi:hypothetical protein
MSSLQKNVASQNIGFVLTNISNGTPVTAGGAGNIVIDNGTQNACAGTFTHKGSGQWNYAPTQAETNGNCISFAFTGTSAIQVGMTFYTLGFDPTQSNLPVNLKQIVGQTVPAPVVTGVPRVDAQQDNNIVRGTCSGGTTTTAVASGLTYRGSALSLTDVGQLIGRTIIFDANTTTTNLQAQASNITGSTTGATPTLTFTAMTHAPANGDTFSVV